MRRLLLVYLLLTYTLCLRAQVPVARELHDLNQAISDTAKYDGAKRARLMELKKSFATIDKTNLPSLFILNDRLFEEYKVYNYDSAFSYARQLQQTALQLGDAARIAHARLQLGFCLLAAGLYKETLDSLQKIDIHGLPDSLRAEYYSLLGRYFYNLGDFDNDDYNTPAYTRKGNAYMDSALRLYPAGSSPQLYYKGLRDIKTGHPQAALYDLRSLLLRSGLSLHEIAITASTLADIYIASGSTDSAISLLIRAAIADIHSSTRETAAIFNLAQLLYKKGDVRNAATYIELAIRDATFYGARQRKVQVSAILPLIEGEKVSRVEEQKRTLVTYSIIATLLLLLVIVLIIVVLRQVRKGKAAQRIITEAHSKEQAINQRLLETNSKLSEANKIKEEYIGYFFNADTEFFDRIGKFKKALEQRIAYRKWEDIITLVNNTNLKKEREELLQNFDKVFLRLFPDFIQRFNELFREEDKVQLKDHEWLNTDLRIFALIRMGIHDTEKIARILEYSVNTINTYKTRIKNRSIVQNEEFEQKIMEIKTI